MRRNLISDQNICGSVRFQAKLLSNFTSDFKEQKTEFSTSKKSHWKNTVSTFIYFKNHFFTPIKLQSLRNDFSFSLVLMFTLEL